MTKPLVILFLTLVFAASTYASNADDVVVLKNGDRITGQIKGLQRDPGFWKSLEGSIDFGFSFTSGNDQYQTDLSATATYRTGDHSFTASIDSVFNGQTEGASTTRRQFTFDYRKQLTPRTLWEASLIYSKAISKV